MASSMNIETNMNQETNHTEKPNKTLVQEQPTPKNWPIIIINSVITGIGAIGGPLLMRLYYLHGGNRRWLSSCVQTAGFPILIIPLTFLYFQHHSKQNPKNHLSSTSFWMEPKLFISSAVIGTLFGLDNFMYALGLSYIPISTSSLLFATQLAFVAFFAWFIVKQKFTPYSINSVILMTLGSILLGVDNDGDRPMGVTKAQYLLGFLLTLGSAALIGFMLPLVELCYSKATRTLSYSTVLQFQITLALFSTIFNAIGMLANKDFQAIPREAREFGLGETMYYVVLVAGAIVWQLSFIGGLGVILYTSSLFSGILTSVLLPFTEVAAVIVYHESFTGQKGMSLALCLWGFSSYFYGEYKMSKDSNPIISEKEDDLPCLV